jgi:hypothetical protein
VLKVQRRLYSLWEEALRVAEALERQESWMPVRFSAQRGCPLFRGLAEDRTTASNDSLDNSAT